VDVFTATHIAAGPGCVPLGATEAAEHRAALLVQQHVRSVDGAMTDAEIVQVRERRGHGRAETGYHLSGLPAQPGQIATGYAPQDEAVRRIAPFHPEELHHTRMGEGSQDRGLPSESPPLLGRVGLLVHQARIQITCYLHYTENSCITLEKQQTCVKTGKMTVRPTITSTHPVALRTGS
jgi:hypothetical protein